MLKLESERAIRYLCHEWLEGQSAIEKEHPSFVLFVGWIREHYAHVLNFKSTIGQMEDAERWFDHELRQSWRN
jgi:hypothetical protein